MVFKEIKESLEIVNYAKSLSYNIRKKILAPGESTVVELIFKTRTYKTRISKKTVTCSFTI